MRPLLVITLIIILFSCGGNPEENAKEITFEYKDISAKEKIKLALDDDYLSNLGFDAASISYLNNYYKQRDYKPNWITDSCITDLGNRMKYVLIKHITIGIPENRNVYPTTFNFIQDEIAITANVSKSIMDLENGMIDYEKKELIPEKFIAAARLDSLLDFEENGDLRHQFIKFGPADTTYEVLSKGLTRMIDDYPMDTSTFQVRSVKYDSTVSVEMARIALVSKGYLEESIKDSTEIAEALKVFQVHNGLKPDGVIGKFTSKCLNESTYNKIQRVIVAMDKKRAERDYPAKYIRINIPEYLLRYYSEDSLRTQHNIVVGKYENQTPELESKLRKLVVYPFWNVPYSISSKEILPSAKYNSGYFAKHNYKIYKQGEEVDPLTVNWKGIRQNAFPYKVVQQPGPSNSLGVIKFDFYNEHSVYFHDTPAKGLFGADVRAYSHGCMRTQHPVDLAKMVLHYDSLSPRRVNSIRPDSLDSLLDLGENYEILLREKVPIFVDYVTVARSSDNKMIVYHDVYGRDEEYVKILNEN